MTLPGFCCSSIFSSWLPCKHQCAYHVKNCLFQHFFPFPFWLSAFASAAALLSPSITMYCYACSCWYHYVVGFPSHPTFVACLQLVFAYMQQPVQLLVCHFYQDHAHVGNFLVESIQKVLVAILRRFGRNATGCLCRLATDRNCVCLVKKEWIVFSFYPNMQTSCYNYSGMRMPKGQQ